MSTTPPGIGAAAPDFTLPISPDKTLALADLPANSILLFYPFDWNPTCVSQLGLFNQLLPQIESYNAHLYAIGVDSPWSHAAFAAAKNLAFPLLSDYTPPCTVAAAYGLYNASPDVRISALFLLNADHTIRWSTTSYPGLTGADGLLAVLAGKPAPGSPTLQTPISAKDHVQGSLTAMFVLVEYGDYQSSATASMQTHIPEIINQYGVGGLVYIFRHFPLTALHPEAQTAAEVAEFAAAHGKFWEMHTLLLENQKDLGPALYTRLAKSLSLDPTALEQALAAKTYAPQVQASFADGVASGVNGTPCFFTDGTRYDGRLSADGIIEIFNAILAPD